MVLRSGREISLNNKTQLLLIGLTTLLVSGFILGGACYALLLTQLEELKVEMRKIEGTVNQKADVDDLGDTINEPYRSSVLVNARIASLSRAQKENYQMLQQIGLSINQQSGSLTLVEQVAKLSRTQDDHSLMIEQLSHGNKTEQRVGDRVVEDEQFSKLLRAQEENHKLYQQLALSVKSLETNISDLQNEFGHQETDIANLRTDSQAADTLMIVDIASLNESINHETSLLYSMLDGMNNASDSMLVHKSRPHPTTPSIEKVDPLLTNIENVSSAIHEAQGSPQHSTAHIASSNGSGLTKKTEKNNLHTQLNSSDENHNRTSRDFKKQQVILENVAPKINENTAMLEMMNFLRIQLNNLEKSTTTAIAETSQNVSNIMNHTLSSIETLVSNLKNEFGQQTTDIANIRTDLRAAYASMIGDFALLNESLNFDISVLHSILDGMDKASDGTSAHKSKPNPTPWIEMIDLLHTKIENMSTAIIEFQDFLHNTTALVTSINESGLAERNLLYTQLNNLEINLNGTSRNQQNMLENINLKMNEQTAVLELMNESATADRNSLYAQLQNLDKFTTTAFDETARNISNINLEINEQTAMLELMNESATAERNSLYAQLQNLDKSTTTAFDESARNISNINLEINEQTAMLELMNESATADRNSLYAQLQNLDKFTTTAFDETARNISNINLEINEQTAMLELMNESATAERNSLYAQLQNLDKSTTTAFDESARNISNINLEINEQTAMLELMNESATAERNSLYGQLQNLDKSTTTAFDETARNISNINLKINEQTAMLELMNESATAERNSLYTQLDNVDKSTATTIDENFKLLTKRRRSNKRATDVALEKIVMALHNVTELSLADGSDIDELNQMFREGLYRLHSCDKCTQTKPCTIGELPFIFCQRGYIQSHSKYVKDRNYEHNTRSETILKNPGLKRLSILFPTFEVQEMSGTCEKDFVEFGILDKSYRHCGTGITNLVFDFDVSAVDDIYIRFKTDGTGKRKGFMIEFNFELLPYTESAYQATINDVKHVSDWDLATEPPDNHS